MSKEIKDTDVMPLIDVLYDEIDSHKTPKLLYGTIVSKNDGKYVILDGSDALTPISESNECITGDRVTVQIVNHEAIITGNLTSPASARTATDFLKKDSNGNILFGNMQNGDVTGTHWEIRDGVFELIGSKGESMTEINPHDKEMTVFGISLNELEKKITDVADSYISESTMSSYVERTEERIYEQVSASYSLKAELSNAVININQGVDLKLTEYTKTVDMETYIDRTAEAITLHAEKTYLTQAVFDEEKGNFYKKEEFAADLEVASESIIGTVSKTYTTKEEFNGLTIGGRNLIGDFNTIKANCTFNSRSGTLTSTTTSNTYANYVKLTRNHGNYAPVLEKQWDTVGYKTFTFAVGNTFDTIWDSFNIGFNSDHSDALIKLDASKISLEAGKEYTLSFKIESFGSSGNGGVISGIKLEEGNKATTYTPAPEDIDGDMTIISERVEKNVSKIEAISDKISLSVTKEEAINLLGGGRNLFLNTKGPWTNSNYLVVTFAPALNPLVPGETYTATMCVTPGAGTEGLNFYFCQGGLYPPGVYFVVNGTQKQTISKTFTMPEYLPGRGPSNNILNAYAYVYRFPNGLSTTTTLHWIQIEKGSIATDWSPAPEEMYDRVKSAEASIDIQAEAITQKVSSTDFNGNKMISLINQDSSSVTINANKINLVGNVTITNMNNSISETTEIAELSKLMLSGKLVFTDPTFLKGLNNVNVYDNNSSGAVKVTREYKTATSWPAGCPTSSNYWLKITSSNKASPGNGGFVQYIYSRANAIFIVKYLAWLPTNYSLQVAANSMGDGRIDKLIGDNRGTGNWKEYYRLIKCGSTGTFSTGGHVWLDGPGGTQTTWCLGGIWCYDVTDVNPIDNWRWNDSTTIDGGYIQTNTIKASSIDTDSLATTSLIVGMKNATAAAQTSADSSIKKLMTKIDLTSSTYNTDTYYPVYQYIPQNGIHEYEVAVQLGGYSKPPWSTHASGFSCNLKINVIAYGWGTTASNLGWISVNTYFWCNKMPAYVRQYGNDSVITFFLRGGGVYFVYSDYSSSWGIASSTYTTPRGDVISPTTAPSNGYYYAPLQNIGAWCKSNDVTYIDGGKIYTGSIKAASIDVDDLFSRTISCKNFTLNSSTNPGVSQSHTSQIIATDSELTLKYIMYSAVNYPTIQSALTMNNYGATFTGGLSMTGSLTVGSSIYEGGTILSSKYAALSHTHSYNPVISMTSNNVTIGTDNASCSPGSYVNKGSVTVTAGTWLFIIVLHFNEPSSPIGIRQLRLATNTSSSDPTPVNKTSYDNRLPSSNSIITTCRVTIALELTGNATYYIMMKHTHSSTVTTACRFTAIKLK